ncbi:hypothetical protein [Flavobacterium filum]|uniref:hypothetical protein n=1 Tax=Flavobacterium TaxID=237 RepID=UPI0023F135DA|nr:hypothetical protein [Flavobacterium filum]
MKTVKDVCNNHKGYFSFLLLFVFLYSGFVRSYVVTDFSSQPVKKSIQAYKNTQVAQQHDHLIIFNAVNQLEKSDSESDDLHHDYISFEKATTIASYVANVTISPKLKFAKAINLPLYDLFCKWKFHLS